tara:strand:+ start:918 stop:1385 length:468 start_codon:yes stop_codon:yes gene_type:complete
MAVPCGRYAAAWDWRRFNNAPRETPLPSAPTNASLWRFQLHMASYGYDTYLLHAVKARGAAAAAAPDRLPPNASRNPLAATLARGARLTLVPVSGAFWRPELELCAHRHDFYSGFCWNDILVARRANRCLKRLLLSELTETHQRFGASCGRPECF